MGSFTTNDVVLLYRQHTITPQRLPIRFTTYYPKVKITYETLLFMIRVRVAPAVPAGGIKSILSVYPPYRKNTITIRVQTYPQIIQSCTTVSLDIVGTSCR